MANAPKVIWAAPDDGDDWGVLTVGEDVFWEQDYDSIPVEREENNLVKYIRADLVEDRNFSWLGTKSLDGYNG